MIKAIVTDIEGTTSSIAFVHETLFPYAREHIAEFVRRHADEPVVREQIDAVSAEVGATLCLDMVIQTLCDWIDADKKATSLKALQGMIWEQGYKNGELKGHVYADAVDALRQWHAQGLGLYVYSSGSVQAQKLIFGHTAFGDLTPLFSGYFDTRIGHKQSPAAYQSIATQIDLPAEQRLFLSDVEAELDAAAEVGMQTCQLVRPGEGLPGHGHTQARDFSEIALGFGQ
ncbi:MAG: acireductone synthase [Nevskiales bacterium]